jgi:hypothetical protein
MTDRRIFLWIASIMTAICLALLGIVIYAAATARADSSCTSSRNGWVYDRCTAPESPLPARTHGQSPDRTHPSSSRCGDAT